MLLRISVKPSLNWIAVEARQIFFFYLRCSSIRTKQKDPLMALQSSVMPPLHLHSVGGSALCPHLSYISIHFSHIAMALFDVHFGSFRL